MENLLYSHGVQYFEQSDSVYLLIMRIFIPSFLVFATFVFIATSGTSQCVFSVEYASQADVKVFVVEYASQADLLVYKVDYASQAKGNEGHWFFVDYASQADKKLFFVDYASQADLKIHFADYASQAGWRNKEKLPLMY